MNFTLRPWREEDAASLAQAANDPAVAANLRDAFPCPYSLADAQWFINDCIAHNRQDRLVYAVTVGGRPVGCVSVQLQSDVYRKSAELGYWLAEDYWGQGIMTEAVKQICREGYDRWEDLVRIYAEPFAHNTASRRVLEKAGFQLEGVMRESVCKRGRVYDSCMYALLMEDMDWYERERDGRETH